MDATPSPLAHALAQSPGLDAHYTLTGDGLQCKYCERYATHQVSNARLHLAARHETAFQELTQAEQDADAQRLALAQQQAAAAAHLATPPAPRKKAAKTANSPLDRS